MDTRAAFAIALALIAACYPAEDYQEDSAQVRCALYEECGFLSSLGVDDFDGCLELLRSEAYACEEYDPAAADLCVAELEELSCEEYSTGYFPTACLDACTLAE
jgi:hypothetical protein